MNLTCQKLVKKARRNLFQNPIDTIITIILLSIIYWTASSVLRWLFTIADWTVVTENLRLYIFGSYPVEKQWRPQLWLTLLSALSLFTLLGRHKGHLKKSLSSFWIMITPLGIFLLAGGFGLSPVKTSDWGGILLTLILTLCSALLALPLGIFLALGRHSSLTFVSSICRVYIDLMRSIPLIAVLFFGQLLIPLFLPVSFEISRFIRAVLAFGLFASSYVAEDIRGGLQAIPPTQYEASAVLGLNPKQTLQLVVLPQALKTALPALTNQAIGLLQNTSLMAILGLVELLGISRSILANPDFIGRYLEVYIWLAVVYWLICTVIALLSRQIEHQLNPQQSPK